jgi:hypothetical protein
MINFEEALDMAKKAGGGVLLDIVTEDQIECRSDVTFIEAVLVFQEFITELAGVIQVKSSAQCLMKC